MSNRLQPKTSNRVMVSLKTKRILIGSSVFAVFLAFALIVFFTSENETSYAGSGSSTAQLDSDGDGVKDNKDKDDDNDGIPDQVEEKVIQKYFINGSFEEAPHTSANTQYSPSSVNGWQTDISGYKIEIIKASSTTVAAVEGDYYCELNSNKFGGIYQDFDVTAGDKLYYSFNHRGAAGKDKMKVLIGAVGNLQVKKTVNSNTNKWKKVNGYYKVPNNVSVLRFYMQAFSSYQNDSTVGNLIDDVVIYVVKANEADSDGDGIPNRLDLDSDNDGILDVTEAGGADPNNDGIVGGTVISDHDNDGILDIVDPDHSQGNELIPPDTDNDGVLDFLDIDSDNDGIGDMLESRTTANFVALTGQDTDGDGIDNAFETNIAAFNPIDADSDNTPDYLDLDADADGISDHIEAFDFNNDGVSDVTQTFGDYDTDGMDNGFDADTSSTDNTSGAQNQQTPNGFPSDNTGSTEPAWRSSSSVTLPIELMYFTGKAEDNIVYLEWKTAMEVNNSRFVVERSSDAVNYEIIHEYPGAGNSTSPIEYFYEDQNPLQAYSYYRLTQIDFDGKSETFDPISINMGTTSEERLAIDQYWPNPFTTKLDIRFFAPNADKGQVQMYDNGGQLVYNREVTMTEGNNTVTLSDLDRLKPGYYLLRIVDGTSYSESVRVLKR